MVCSASGSVCEASGRAQPACKCAVMLLLCLELMLRLWSGASFRMCR
jgi:hypothetical protein